MRQAARGWGQETATSADPSPTPGPLPTTLLLASGSWPIRFCDRPSKSLGPMWEPLGSASHPEPLPREPSMPWACWQQHARASLLHVGALPHPGLAAVTSAKDCHSCCTVTQGSWATGALPAVGGTGT